MTTAAIIDVARANLLTSNQRLHWAQKSRRTKALRGLAYYAGRPTAPFPDRVRLVVDIAWPDARRRDRANIQPTVKACVDGLVDAGWITDDDDEHLDGPDLRTSDQRCDKGLACQLTFTFEEAS